MLGVAVFLTAILAVAGEDVYPTDVDYTLDVLDPSSLVGQLTVSQLKELIAETMTQAIIPLHHNCTDYSEMGDCGLVVEHKLCGAKELYARYCCRSCTLAKQIPTYGPHLSLTAKVPISINVTTDTIRYPRGSNVTITCEATGYPTPEVVWFRNYNEISSTGEYHEETEVLGGILMKTIRSNLIIDNFSVDYSHFQCMAINSEGIAKSSITIYIEDELSVDLFPEVPIMEAKDDVVLDCVATGSDVNEVIWFREVELIHNSNEYRIIERRSFEEGLTKIHSKLTILRHKTEDSGSLFTCSAIDRKGGNKEKWKRVYISDDSTCSPLLCEVNASLLIKGIKISDTGKYICRTSNVIDMKDATVLLRLTEDGEIYIDVDYNDSTCSPLLCEVNASLLIKGIKISDTGKYICRTSNVIDMKDATVLLRLTEDGEIYIDVDYSSGNGSFYRQSQSSKEAQNQDAEDSPAPLKVGQCCLLAFQRCPTAIAMLPVGPSYGGPSCPHGPYNMPLWAFHWYHLTFLHVGLYSSAFYKCLSGIGVPSTLPILPRRPFKWCHNGPRNGAFAALPMSPYVASVALPMVSFWSSFMLYDNNGHIMLID
ncbi:hemicentin-1-like [Penaeus indicus]|uniref:hemicentin-1-like n=1 Tax=Penaeus indicus TaxID=29960 RepID=UPI00300D26A8